jgi:hypothetical protein
VGSATGRKRTLAQRVGRGVLPSNIRIRKIYRGYGRTSARGQNAVIVYRKEAIQLSRLGAQIDGSD